MAHKYAISCLPFRSNFEHGEDTWHSLMQVAVRISRDDIAENCDLHTFLEDGESLEEYLAADPCAATYRAELDGRTVYFIQFAGIEFFFTEDGEVPHGTAPGFEYLRDLFRRDEGRARVLLGANDGRLCGLDDEETDNGEIEEGLKQIQGLHTRYVLSVDGVPVAGARIEDDHIESVYTAEQYRRKGYASLLVRKMLEVHPEITLGRASTPEQECFRRACLDAKREEGMEPGL